MSPPIKERVRQLLWCSPTVYNLARRSGQAGNYLLRRPHEADFAAFAHFRERTGTFLDVGANSGTSAMSFRIFHRASPIFSVEANRLLEGDLRFVARIVPRFEFRILAAGDSPGQLTLHVPVYRGIGLTGAASLDREVVTDHWCVREMVAEGVDSDQFEIVAQPVEVRPLDELGLEPDFVKIDVEGVELEVVHGLTDTIARCRPIILIERSRSFEPIRAELGELGYRTFTYSPQDDRLLPYGGVKRPNAFFLPPDALDSSAVVSS